MPARAAPSLHAAALLLVPLLCAVAPPAPPAALRGLPPAARRFHAFLRDARTAAGGTGGARNRRRLEDARRLAQERREELKALARRDPSRALAVSRALTAEDRASVDARAAQAFERVFSGASRARLPAPPAREPPPPPPHNPRAPARRQVGATTWCTRASPSAPTRAGRA